MVGCHKFFSWPRRRRTVGWDYRSLSGVVSVCTTLDARPKGHSESEGRFPESTANQQQPACNPKHAAGHGGDCRAVNNQQLHAGLAGSGLLKHTSSIADVSGCVGWVFVGTCEGRQPHARRRSAETESSGILEPLYAFATRLVGLRRTLTVHLEISAFMQEADNIMNR